MLVEFQLSSSKQDQFQVTGLKVMEYCTTHSKSSSKPWEEETNGRLGFVKGFELTEHQNTKTVAEFLRKWKIGFKMLIGLSFVFVITISGLIAGLVILHGQLQVEKIRNHELVKDSGCTHVTLQNQNLLKQNKKMLSDLRQFELAKELAKDYLKIEGDCNKTFLYTASLNGELDKVAFFLDIGADINAKTCYDNITLLHVASQNGHLAVAKVLLYNGANVNVRGTTRLLTPLHYAIQYGHDKIVEILIDNGADVNAKNGKLQTPLHYAAQFGYEKIVENLIQNGANVNAENDDGENALYLAAFHGYLDIVECLLKYGAKKGSMGPYWIIHNHSYFKYTDKYDNYSKILALLNLK